MKTAQSLLGHATSRMTLEVYTQTTGDAGDRAATMMEQVLGPVRAPGAEELTTEEGGWNTEDDSFGPQPGPQQVSEAG